MTLDPKDPKAFRQAAHDMLDAALDKLETVREGRVWTAVPDSEHSRLNMALPREGMSSESIQSELEALLPYGVGNTHPRFFGWVHGAGAASGLLADMAMGAMNVNAGGRHHIAPIIEQQVIRWAAEMTGMPEGSSGLVVSGTSMATIIALKTARDNALRNDENIKALTGYTSEQTHSCVERAFDLLGLGTHNLRKVPCNEAFEMDIRALLRSIRDDRAAGYTPFVIIGTAGAVNMGAIDDLEALADLAQSERLWFHIDGAFGAAANIGQLARERLTGLGRAQSLAFDFHKWLQVNYDAGIVLIRDRTAHRAAFAQRPEYLRGSERGLAGGDFWAVDYGPELSRSFRALKVWAHLRQHGINKLADIIDRNIEQAQYLERLVQRSDHLEMLAPVPLNICCFRYVPGQGDLDTVNQEIVIRLQEEGIAVTSSTRINGQFAIRVNITNHRTRKSDLDILVGAIERIGAALSAD